MNCFLMRACGGLLAITLGACVHAPEELRHTAQYEPVHPVEATRAPRATGAIFNPQASRDLFSRGLSYQVGDVVTVLLNESAQAARQQSSVVSRDSSNDALPAGLSGKVGNFAKVLDGLSLNGASISNEGNGTADQRASLTGSISATVVQVLANGNLVLRGEKQLALTQGTEIIQVNGIVRPEDISANNTVQSRRLANAQITYRGSGDLANASRPGWGTSFLLRFWPF